MTPPVDVSVACPDCTSVAVGWALNHDESCPIGADIERTNDADRQFFVDHPGTWIYWRPITASEVADLRRAGTCPDVPGRVVGRVRVTTIAEGVRLRWFGEVAYLVDLGAPR